MLSARTPTELAPRVMTTPSFCAMAMSAWFPVPPDPPRLSAPARRALAARLSAKPPSPPPPPIDWATRPAEFAPAVSMVPRLSAETPLEKPPDPPLPPTTRLAEPPLSPTAPEALKPPLPPPPPIDWARMPAELEPLVVMFPLEVTPTRATLGALVTSGVVTVVTEPPKPPEPPMLADRAPPTTKTPEMAKPPLPPPPPIDWARMPLEKAPLVETPPVLVTVTELESPPDPPWPPSDREPPKVSPSVAATL